MKKNLTAWLIRLVSGVRPIPVEMCPPGSVIYFANHSSHLDFLTIWAALPVALRTRTRPVAGRDYWEKTALRRHIARDLFNAVLIERQHVTVATNPLAPMLAALDAGDSLIVFPEGTRSPDGRIHAFKPGIHHLARSRPETAMVPVYLQDLSRILPKGDVLPVPLIASLTVGAPLRLQPEESKQDFLRRAQGAVENLAHSYHANRS
ncbi:MAG: 1-acyl-sn-glycerol-3-phosphate acyltransferase [Opitutaceae bacterium]|nr:1-acyl-sn-glycerol-3-phosphate acyltransferase [Opitutaceae bacterium]MBP9911882.1 1-acyl-sn-glycerol-3-phosphate acyltransferase [Opitutaceae bacterium]